MSSSHRRIIKMKRPISRVVVVPTHGQNTQLDVMDGSPADFLETHPDMLTEIPDVAPEPPGVRISEEALEQIRAEAYDQGLQDGAQHAAEEARRHLDKTFQTLNGMIDTIAQHQQIIYRHSEAGCVELVFAMVEKVVGALDHSQKQTIHETLNKVLKSAEIAGRVKILVNPQDLQHIKSMENDLRGHFPDLKDLGILPDESIGIGGCIIETDLGKVDARINTQMSEMVDKLRKYYKELEHNEDESTNAAEV